MPSDPLAAIVIGICVSCRPLDGPDEARPGAALLAALREALGDHPVSGLAVRPIQCLSVCKRPCTASLTGAGRYTYVFGDLDPEMAATALLDCAKTYAADAHGYLLWRERPESLRRGIVARIPPPDWQDDTGGHPR